MAKGLEKHKERINELTSFGKNLIRRSASSCELCSKKQVQLKIYELPPVSKSPDYERCLLVCDECRDQIENPKKIKSDYWRCLNNTVWSETAVIQALSIRMLNIIAVKNSWAEELLDQVYPDQEVEEMVGEIN